MAPQFSLELRDTVALENEKAEFLVHFHGIPTPKIVWYKEGFEIFSSRRMRVTVENDVSSLIIHQTAFTDEGEYKCTATNRAGHIITKAKLRLEAPPRIRLPRQYEDGLIFEKDEVIRLKVSVAGRPLPRTTWYHDGQPIPFGGRYEVSNTDRSSGLRISEAQRGDRGEYQVQATSRLGEDAVSFLVTVTDRPMPPGRPEVTATTGRSVTLCWTEPDDDGGCKIGNYIVEYYRLGWNVWLKASTCRHLTTSLSDLIEGSEYKFRVKAENPYGVSEPSCESTVVFIPDPKRGLLEQAVRGSANRTDIISPNQLTENKSENKIAGDLSVGRRKYIQENEEGERKYELPGKELAYSKELKRTESSFAQQEMSEVTRRKNEENHERTEGNRPSLVRRQRHKNVDETDLEKTPESPLQTCTSLPEAEKGFRASLQFSVAKRRDSSGERDSGVSEGSVGDGKQNLATSLVPREDDSLLHGSSELMLVLLPQTRDTHSDRDVEYSSDFAGFGDFSVPPPLSLSAPELGSGDPWVTSPLRNAVSSTELLHEQAMARFYRAVAAEEESERASQRKVIDPPAILLETGEFSRKAHTRTLEIAPKQELRWHKGKEITLQENWASAGDAEDSSRTDMHLKSTLGRKEPVRRYAEEEEEEEEEDEEEEEEEDEEEEEEEGQFERLGIKTVAEYHDIERRSIIGRGKNEEKTRQEEKEAKKEDKMKLQEVDEEEQVEEDIFEEFSENEELKEEESLGEESSEFDEEEDLYKSMEAEESMHQSSGLAAALPIERFAEQEDETYHPRIMVALPKVSERQHPTHPTADASNAFPSILKHNIRFQEDLEDRIHRKHEMPLRELERSPPRSFRESLPKELKPSFIPDTPSRSIYPFEPQRLEQSHALSREADVRLKEFVRLEDDEVSIPAEAAPSVKRPVHSKAGSRISAPKPNGHIAAAAVSTTESTGNTAKSLVVAPEAAKQKRMLSRKTSLEEDTEASRAVADYYGDIIRDYARPKKTVRQFLNTTEMKAAARVSQQKDTCVSASEPAATRKPEEGLEKEAECSIETPTVTAVQRQRRSRSKSRISEVNVIRKASKDRSRVPSTERFSGKMSQKIPELARGSSPERTQPEELTEELRPASTKLDAHLQLNYKKWRSVFGYLADVAMFCVACWLYAFKDERLAIPVLVLMVFRQFQQAVKRKLPKLPQLPWKRSS